LLSKRSEMFLPDQWPSYFRRAKGVKVWDLDGNSYIDMSYMGIGACVLGYADSDVNRAVKKVVDQGSMCTLNSPEEVELAELLLQLDPWAEQVRFARSGGEAMAIAVRIARGFTKKDTVAFCGYHGWYDWYLAANLADDKNLDGQLLKGLKPLGVPRGLKGTAIPFNYNKIDELKNIVKNNNIGVIVMEPVREHEPKKGFLNDVQEIARKIGAVLIFDEVTSGFRMRVGGVYPLYGGKPDIVVYGKAMGNGFPISAVVGKKNIMDIAQESFISSTMWTERVGPAAALATIRKMQTDNVPQHLVMVGKLITKEWQQSAKVHGLNIQTFGIPVLPTFTFDYGKDNQALHTLFNQEMLKRGYLTTKSVYVSWSHTEKHVKDYFVQVDEVFGIIKKALETSSIDKLLEGPVVHTGFQRLT